MIAQQLAQRGFHSDVSLLWPTSFCLLVVHQWRIRCCRIGFSIGILDTRHRVRLTWAHWWSFGLTGGQGGLCSTSCRNPAGVLWLVALLLKLKLLEILQLQKEKLPLLLQVELLLLAVGLRLEKETLLELQLGLGGQ